MVFAKGWPWTTIFLPVPPIGITEMSHNTYFVEMSLANFA
jgi:hypothetical protein